MIITEPIVTTKCGYQFFIPIDNGVEDCCVVHYFGKFHGNYSSHARTCIRRNIAFIKQEKIDDKLIGDVRTFLISYLLSKLDKYFSGVSIVLISNDFFR